MSDAISFPHPLRQMLMIDLEKHVADGVLERIGG